MKYMHTWSHIYETLLKRIEAKIEACKLLMRDDLLLKVVLQYILMIGNTMNRDNNRLCNVSGFQLDILPKLLDTKAQSASCENKPSNYTLMHYLADLLEQQEDEKAIGEVKPSEFFKEFDKEVEICTKITTQTILALLNELNRHVNHFTEEYEYYAQNSNENAETMRKLSEMKSKTTQEYQHISSLVEQYKTLYSDLAIYYHFENASSGSKKADADDDSTDPLFTVFHKFVAGYKAALEENKNQQQLARSRSIRSASMSQLRKKRRLENNVVEAQLIDLSFE